MKIKTRKRKKRICEAPKCSNEVTKKHFTICDRCITEGAKGRPKEISGVDGKGLYLYNYIKNRAEKVVDDRLRYYLPDGRTYIEVSINKDYLVLRATGSGLVQLLVRGQAANCLEVKALPNRLNREATGSIWSEDEL